MQMPVGFGGVAVGYRLGTPTGFAPRPAAASPPGSVVSATTIPWGSSGVAWSGPRTMTMMDPAPSRMGSVDASAATSAMGVAGVRPLPDSSSTTDTTNTSAVTSPVPSETASAGTASTNLSGGGAAMASMPAPCSRAVAVANQPMSSSAASSPSSFANANANANDAAPPLPLPQPPKNSRLAQSSVTGKRLNWADMICRCLSREHDTKMVIAELFNAMIDEFPAIREWAYGKDWEARVKNRIKSTLSIKPHLFLKVSRPSSAPGKGSWWMLKPEAKHKWVGTGRHVQSVVTPASAAGGGGGEHRLNVGAGWNQPQYHSNGVVPSSGLVGVPSPVMPSTVPPPLPFDLPQDHNHGFASQPLFISTGATMPSYMVQQSHPFGTTLAGGYTALSDPSSLASMSGVLADGSGSTPSIPSSVESSRRPSLMTTGTLSTTTGTDGVLFGATSPALDGRSVDDLSAHLTAAAALSSACPSSLPTGLSRDSTSDSMSASSVTSLGAPLPPSSPSTNHLLDSLAGGTKLTDLGSYTALSPQTGGMASGSEAASGWLSSAADMVASPLFGINLATVFPTSGFGPGSGTGVSADDGHAHAPMNGDTMTPSSALPVGAGLCNLSIIGEGSPRGSLNAPTTATGLDVGFGGSSAGLGQGLVPGPGSSSSSTEHIQDLPASISLIDPAFQDPRR